MLMEKDLSRNGNGMDLRVVGQTFVRESKMPLYEQVSRKLEDEGVGSFTLMRSDEQVDSSNLPIEVDDVVRVDEYGQKDWLPFWEMAEEAEYYLKKCQETNPEIPFEDCVSRAVNNAFSQQLLLVGYRKTTIQQPA